MGKDVIIACDFADQEKLFEFWHRVRDGMPETLRVSIFSPGNSHLPEIIATKGS